jgi:hypothetical protein
MKGTEYNFFLCDQLLKDRGQWIDLVIDNLQKVETSKDEN